GKPVGIAKRVLWTTSKVKGSPEPPAPYRAASVFPKLKFFEPLAMSAIPGTNRFVIAQRDGKLFTFENNQAVEKADLLLDVGHMTYGVVAHPQFRTNGYVYVTYISDNGQPSPTGSKVARYQIRPDRPWECDPQSGKIIFEWPSRGHNSGNIVF